MRAIGNSAVELGIVRTTPMTGACKPSPLTVRVRSGESRLVFAAEPGGFAAERYRVMRRQLVEQYPDGAILLVTSPGSGEGKTVTSTNLAWCLAEAGMPTLLAEMDLRNPSIDALLGCNLTGAGIESVLGEGTEPAAILRQINRMQLYLATAGKVCENPVDLFSSSLLRSFLDWGRQHHKWVVLDSPPLLALSDSIELSAVADATLLVVRARITPKVLVERAIELLGPRLSQVIMNDGTVCADSSHRYFNSSYPYPYGPKKKPRG